MEVGAQLIHRVDNVSSHPGQFVEFQNELWFAAETRAAGREWWKTDGTTDGTILAIDVVDGPASSYPVRPLEFDAQLFFGAFGSQDLYRTDGTASTRVLEGTGVNHISTAVRTTPHRSRPQLQIGSYPIAIVNNRLVAQHSTGGGADGDLRRLVSFDSATATPYDTGAVAGKSKLFPLGHSVFFDAFTVVNDHLVFRSTRSFYSSRSTFLSQKSKIYGTDGLTTETLSLPLSAGGVNGYPAFLDNLETATNGLLRFAAAKACANDGAFTGMVVIQTDGTEVGTQVTAARYELWVNQLDDNGNQIAQRIDHNTQLTSLQVDLNSSLSTGNYAVWLRVISNNGGNVIQSPWSEKTNFTLS